MSSICINCEYFYGYDGITEIWTGCSLIGEFKGGKKKCHDFKKKITKEDLLKEILKLKEENRLLKEKLRKEI